MAYRLDFALSLGVGKAGLNDLRAQLVNTGGANVGAAVATGFTEIGSGTYLWDYAAIPDGHRGGVKFYSNATPAVILAFAPVNPEEAENLDAKISAVLTAFGSVADPLLKQVPGTYPSGSAGWTIGNLVSFGITYTGPVNPASGSVSLIRGDDYFSADGRALVFLIPSGGGNPNLTGATVALNFYPQSSTSPIAGPSSGTITNPGTANQAVTFELSAAFTSSLKPGNYQLVAVATLANGHTDTVFRSTCSVSNPPA